MATKKAPVKKASAKKPPVKKPAAKVTAPAKKVVKKTTKKAPTRKKTAAQTATLRSFKVYKHQDNFSKVQFSRQTVYWIILLTVIVITQLWIINIQVEIADLTNELIQNSAEL